MLDILQFLNKEHDVFIETGIVVEYLGEFKYKVNINGQEKMIRSAIPTALSIGTGVVINRKNQARYIVGTTQRLESHIEREVIVDG